MKSPVFSPNSAGNWVNSREGPYILVYMESLHIGLYGVSTNLPFGICAIYIDRKVIKTLGGSVGNVLSPNAGNPFQKEFQRFVTMTGCFPKHREVFLLNMVEHIRTLYFPKQSTDYSPQRQRR